AIDRAALKPLMDYWVAGVNVCGLTELVANALIMEGEGPRSTNLRGEEINDLREEVGLPPIDFPSGDDEEAGEEGEE
ncbi:MAG: hypothetical protein LDL07_10290, partial [Desulfarculus sp.]|nr:hypothetical protein [Desulfarculus sp.]